MEETFRDLKNPRLGLGLKQTVVKRNDRRGALFLLAALAHSLLILLGRPGQDLQMERWQGATRPGGISLFRQGQMLYDRNRSRGGEQGRWSFSDSVREHGGAEVLQEIAVLLLAGLGNSKQSPDHAQAPRAV